MNRIMPGIIVINSIGIPNSSVSSILFLESRMCPIIARIFSTYDNALTSEPMSQTSLALIMSIPHSMADLEWLVA